MKTLVNTKKTFIGLDTDKNLITNRDIPVGITIGQLLYFLSEGGKTSFPFTKFCYDSNIVDSYPVDSEEIKKEFVARGYTKSFKSDFINDFREVYKVSEVLYYVRFFDAQTLEFKNDALLYTLHTAVEYIEIDTDFESFKKENEQNQFNFKN